MSLLILTRYALKRNVPEYLSEQEIIIPGSRLGSCNDIRFQELKIVLLRITHVVFLQFCQGHQFKPKLISR